MGPPGPASPPPFFTSKFTTNKLQIFSRNTRPGQTCSSERLRFIMGYRQVKRVGFRFYRSRWGEDSLRIEFGIEAMAQKRQWIGSIFLDTFRRSSFVRQRRRYFSGCRGGVDTGIQDYQVKIRRCRYCNSGRRREHRERHVVGRHLVLSSSQHLLSFFKSFIILRLTACKATFSLFPIFPAAIPGCS